MAATNAMRPKSGRKALTDLTNNKNKNILKPSIFTTKKNQVEDEKLTREDDVLDTLLLVQSDLTSLLHQIDDLVVQALKLNDIGTKGRKEIKSFAHALSQVSSSLKPWILRLQNGVLSSTVESETQLGESLPMKTMNPVSEDGDVFLCSPERTNLELLISPSPFVSWRADCTINRSRQLFLLTPLPTSKASSKRQCSRYVAQNISDVPKIQLFPELDTFGDKYDYKIEGVTRKPPSGAALVEKGSSKESGCILPEFSKRNCPIVETTRIKTSPPKSCILLEPISKSSHPTINKVYKSTPFRVSNRSLLKPPDCALVEIGTSKENEFTSPESTKRNLSTTVATPCFKTSPFNTRLLLEPISNSFNQAVDNVRKSTPYPVGKQTFSEPDTSESSGSKFSGDFILKYPELGRLQKGPKSLAEKKKYETSPDWFLLLSPPKTCVLMEPPNDKSLPNQNVYGGGSDLADATPMRKEPESTIRTGRRPGENTLKKELWTKFEAASTGLCFQASAFQKTKQKGFLDLLEEASSDETELEF